MIRNLFVLAWRTVLRNRVTTTINVLGLSLGMGAFILIMQYVQFEKSMNQFHADKKNIDRLLFEVSYTGKTFTWESLPPAVGPMARDEFAEVNAYCRITDARGVVSWADPRSSADARNFREVNTIYADGSFFSIFSFPVHEGNASALKDANTAAISASAAKKYFASENPIGKVLSLDNQFGKQLYTVVAVYADFPQNSDLQCDIIFSLQTLANPANLAGSDWARLDGYKSQFVETYLQTREGTDKKSLESKLNKSIKKHNAEFEETVRLQSLASIHLPSSFNDYYTTYGTLTFLYILQGSALLILLIAWFNYINLSTAGAMKRAKEVGIRKVVGANRFQLIRQFLGESLVVNTAGILIALALVNIVQPVYNQIIGKTLSLGIFAEGFGWLSLTALLMAGALASGSYAAFSLSSYRPAETLRGAFGKSGTGVWMRKSLVVFQFSISIVLIGSTFILFRQMQFMRNTDLGVQLDQRLVLAEPTVGADSTRRQRNQSFMDQVAQQSFVKNYSMSGTVPGNSFNYSSGGLTRMNPKPDDDKINYSYTYIDERYLDVYGIALAAGKNFTREVVRRKAAERNSLILNEYSTRLLGFESPEIAIGQKILFNGSPFEITGVVKDYHHQSVKEGIDAMVFFPALNAHYFTIQLEGNQIRTALPELEKLYKSSFPGNPVEYFFADEKFNRQYQAEQQYGVIFTIASVLAIFIACLGLLGLTRFTVEQRIKEIGIRKVLGATTVQITRLLSSDFLTLVMIALLIATPLSWWGMNKWLESFAARIEISAWVYLGTGILAAMITVITVSLQSVRASSGNPVDALKNE